MKKVLLLILVFNFFSAFSQVQYDFFGALKLNGDDKTVITYRLVFQENKGIINGYSITDIGGSHETKNTIIGKYNNKLKEFSFNEEQILYTKSVFQKNSFCYVYHKGKLKLTEGVKKIEGNFSGLYKDGKKCINGTILLVNSQKVTKTVSKFNTKIQKSKKVDTDTKTKYNLVKMLDSLKINNLLKDQNLSVFIKSKKVTIEIWDAKEEDGDIINLFINDKSLLTEYTVLNKKKVIEIPINNEKSILKLEAINEGEVKPNTSMVVIVDGNQRFELSSNLKKFDKAYITLVPLE